MITKGIIEAVLSPYEVKVRIPTLDSVRASSLSTSTENLNTATICTLPNCYTNLKVGDVVFVGFEDNTYYKAVILGHLVRDSGDLPYADVKFGNLVARTSAKLPQETKIGNVTSKELSSLQGTRDNLQKQLDNIHDKIDSLTFESSGSNDVLITVDQINQICKRRT